MLNPQDELTVVPNQSTITPHAPIKGVDENLNIFGGSSNVLPPQQEYDPTKLLEDFAKQPASLQTQMQPVYFDWNEEADRVTQSDYYRTEGYHPYSGTVPDPYHPGKEYSYTEQHYGQMQTFGNVLSKAAGGFAALTSSTFSDSIEGTGRLVNALFNWGSDKTFKERLIGTPEELAIKDEEQKAIFNKYAIFHTPESDNSVFNKQLLGDMITQAGFTIGPMAEFFMEQMLTMGITGAISGFAKGTKFASQSLSAAKIANKSASLGNMINDARKAGSMTSNTTFFTEMVGGLGKLRKWGGRQLNPITGIQDVVQAAKAGTGAWNVGITTVGAAKRMFGQANMAFNEARFEAAGTYGQMVGDLVKKFEDQNGRSPEGAELENIQKYAYGAATDNFIANSGIIMTMNTIQFGNMFSKFSSTSKLLRDAIETGSDVYTVSGKIGGKAATRAYSNAGIFSNPIGTFRKVRKDFGVGTALATVGKRAVTGTAAKFEITEGVQELFQTGSDNTIREYYTNLYDGRTDIDGKNLMDANWMKGMTDQYNLDGWKTFLMGAVTGMLISPVQASVMYAGKKGYARVNDQYKQEVDGYQKAVQDNVDKQNAFYSDINKGLNDAIKNWKIQANASKTMEQALQDGDKYTFFNAKDDSFAGAVNAAIKTNTLPSLIDSIREFATEMSEEELAEAFPGLDKGTSSTSDSMRNYLLGVANDIEQYHSNWERLKEEFAHLVMPEVYKANKEDYAKALLAKRALDESIELLATTDYKATRALTRAGEIKSKIASVPGLGNSASEAFDILLSDDRSMLKIEELKQLLSVGEGIQQSKEEKKLTDLREKQLKALTEWTGYRLLQEELAKTWKAGKKGFDDAGLTQEGIELNNKMAQAFEDYIIAHNSMSGPYNDVVDKSALKKMFGEFGQYIALNRDAGHYLEAMNILSDPRNFEHSYAILKGALEHANEKLKEANIKESKEKIDKDFGVTDTTEEPELEPDTVEDKKSDVESFADRIIAGEQMDTPEELEFYENNKEEIERILAEKKKENDTTTDTEDSTQKEETPEEVVLDIDAQRAEIERRREEELFEPGNKNTDTVEYFNGEQHVKGYLEAGKQGVDFLKSIIKECYSGRSASTISSKLNIPETELREIRIYLGIPSAGVMSFQGSEIGEEGEAITQEKLFNDWKNKIDKINAKYDAELAALAKEKVVPEPQPLKNYGTKIWRLDDTIRIVPGRKETPVQAEKRNAILSSTPVDVLRAGMRVKVTRNQSVTASKPLSDKKSTNPYVQVNGQTYAVEVYYGDTMLGWLSEPYTYTFDFGAGNVPVEQLTIDQFMSVVNIPERYTPEQAFTEFKNNYATGIEFKRNLDALMQGQESIELQGTEIPFILVVSEGSIDTIPEWTYEQRDTLENVLKADGGAKELVGVYDQAQNTMIAGPDTLIAEAVKADSKDILGNYKIGIKLANGKVKWVQGKGRPFTNEEISNKLQQVQEEQKKVKNLKDKGTVPTLQDTAEADAILSTIFITAKPITNAKFYLSLGTDGEFKLTRYTRSKDGDKVVSTHTYKTIPATAKEFRSFLTKEIKKHLTKEPLGLTKEQIDSIEVNENNLRENLPQDASKEDIMKLQVVAAPGIVRNVVLTYITAEPVKSELTNTPPVTETVPVNPPIEGNGTYTIPATEPELKSMKLPEEGKSLADRIAERNANVPQRKVKNRWARKVINAQDAGNYVENISKFRDWMRTNVPQITVEEVDGIIENLTNGNVTVGQFLLDTLNTGKLRGTIKTSPNAAFKYHEAFHGVFRMLLSQNQIDRLLQQAAKESPATFEKLQTFRNLHPEYATMSDQELIDTYYEEYLADKFDTWMNDRSVRTGSGIKEFFARLWDWIREIAARLTGNDIKRMFYQIDRGAFRNVQVQPNQFTNDTSFITTVSSARKVIPIGEQKVGPGGQEVTIMRYLPQSVADTLSTTIAALYFKEVQTASTHNKREVLEKIISKYANLYNPDQEKYKKIADTIEDAHRRDLWWDELIDLYLVFTNPDAKQSLMEAVDVHLRIAGLKQDLEDDAQESFEEEVGSRNTDNFNRNLGTAGDYGSLAKYLRQYIAGTTINYTDEYGNSEFADGAPLIQAVNANHIYNGLLKVLSNSTDDARLLKRLDNFHKYGNNPATNAFIQRLKDDTGLQVNEDGTFSINREGNEILIQQILKGFGQYEVDHKFILIKNGQNTKNDYIVMSANRQNAADAQLKEWSNAYQKLFWNRVESISTKERLLQANSIYSKSLGVLESILKDSDKEIDNTEWSTVSLSISNELKNSLGINLHPVYIQYSIAAGKSPEVRSKAQAEIVEDFKDKPAVTVDILNAIRKNLPKDNIFGKTAEGVSRVDTETGNVDYSPLSRELSLLATGNSYFDETVNTMSYTTSDGETVYAHQLPSFFSVQLFNLNNPEVIAADKENVEKQSSYLLNDENFLDMSEKGMIRMISTDGIRQEGEDQTGVIYGDFNGREQNAYLLGMYTGATKVRGKNGEFWVSPIMVRTVEAKNSAPFVDLPVIGSYINGNLSNVAIDQMINTIRAEVARIERVKKEIKDRKVKKIDGYHTGKKTKKSDWSLPKAGEDTSTWDTPPRGLYLFESAKMVGDLKADIEAGTINEEAIREQLNRYWNDQLDYYVGLMLSQGLIGVGPNGEFVNRLAPSYLFDGMKGSEKGTELNLIPGNFRHNLGQVLINDYLNTVAINTLLRGDDAKLFKDSVDQIKRAAGEAGMGPSMAVSVTCPKWGIDAPLSTVHHVTYRTHEGKDLFGNKIDTDDAQMYITEKALRYMLFGFGKLNQTQVDILDQLRNGEQVSAEQFYGAGGLKEKGPFNSYKLLHYDGETYIKCSAIPLFRDMVSIWQDGEWVANPEYQKLHELLDKMEQQEQEQEADGNNIVVFAHPDTASKSMKKGVVNDIENITANAFNAIPASYTRLQLENPSNKTVITDPTQAKQQIMAEQDDTVIVSFMGVDKTVGEVKDAYMRAVSQRKTNNFNTAVNDIFDMDGAYIELSKSIDMQKVTPKLGRFLLHAQDVLMATGTDSHTMGFYEVDENGNPMYNLNFPSLLPKFTEMFLSYFSKGVLSEKVPGTSVALVSDYGVMKFKRVTSIWQEGDQGYLPEYAGQPKTWQVITTEQVKKDPGYYALNAKRYAIGQEDKRIFSDVQVGDIILDTLRHNYPKYDVNGKYLGRFSEFLMPAQYAEIMKGIPDAYKYMMGVRIPSDDKHSYISLEYVDTLPVQLGSVAIFPRELIRISGADFDIDKVYLEWLDTYKVYRDNELAREYNTISNRLEQLKAERTELQKQFETTFKYSPEIAARKKQIDAQIKHYEQLYMSGKIGQDEFEYKVEELKDERNSLGTSEGKEERGEIIERQKELNEQIEEMKELKRNLQSQIEETAERVAYSRSESTEDNFEEYLIWQAENNKTVKEIVSELEDTANGQIALLLDNDRRILLTALEEVGLPTTPQEFERRGGVDLNNGVQNNIALSAKIAMLNNEYISGDTVEKGKAKASILNQATDTKILKDLVGELRRIFTGMQNDENRSDEDKAGINEVLTMLGDPAADTNSLLGKVLSYTNNKEGSRNIGAAVNAMLTYSILNTNKVKLERPITFGNKTYDTFENHTTNDSIRKFAQISALVNAMTDNAKDPLAAKLGLNIEAVGLVAAMVAVDISTESAVLLMLQPAVRSYFQQVKTLSGQLKTGEELNTSTFNLLPDMMKYYEDKKVKPTFPNYSRLLDNIASAGKDDSLQFGALILLNQVKQISDYMRKVAGVIKLAKGLPTSFAEVDNIKKTLSDIWTAEYISEVPPPFKIYDVLTNKNEIVSTDIRIMDSVLALSTKVFTERTSAVRRLTEDVLSMVNVSSEGKSGEPFRKQLRDDIISYLDIAEYMNLLRENERVGTLQTLHHGLIYDGQGIDTIHQIVNELREKLKGSVEGSNYLVDKYLFLLNSQQSGRGINEVQANIWTKISQAVQERLGAAFMDLYSNSHKDATTGEPINTYPDAMALFHYLLVKDGGQFKNNSFIKYVPNVVFEELLAGAGKVNKDLSSGQGLPIELVENFIDSYGQHINNKKYIKAIQGNPTGFSLSADMSTYTVTIPKFAHPSEGKAFYGGFSIVDGSVIFPTYMKHVTENEMGYTTERLLKLVSTFDTEGVETQRITGTTSTEATSAKYEIVPFRGSVATWKGSGLYGTIPVVQKGVVVQTTNNPGFTTSSPVNQQQEQQEIQDVQVQPTISNWQQHLKDNYGTVYLQRDEYGTATWMILGNGSDTPMTIEQYSDGRASTPQELYTELTGNQIGDTSMESEQPVVSLQPMEPTRNIVASIPQNKVSGVASYGSTTEAADNVKKILGPNPHSIDMIAAGLRTRTTRSADEMAKYSVKVGDVIKHFGKSADGTTKEILARVTAIYPKGTEGWKGTWEKEGWRAQDVSVIDRFAPGAAAIEFEVINPAAPASVQPVSTQGTQAPVSEATVQPGAYVNYNDGIFIVTKKNANGTWQIYDPTKEGTAAKKSVAEKNLKPTGTLGKIVTYKDQEYIVTPKQTIISLTTNKAMQWGEENGDRKAVLALAQGTPIQAAGTQMTGEQWKAELNKLYNETDKSVNERTWTLDKLAIRDARRRAGVPDATILEEIKACK